jgi:hypothetical protein
MGQEVVQSLNQRRFKEQKLACVCDCVVIPYSASTIEPHGKENIEFLVPFFQQHTKNEKKNHVPFVY